MLEIRKRLADYLEQEKGQWSEQRVFAGFDGFVDAIVRVVKSEEGSEKEHFYNEMQELGEYITGRQGRSCCLELQDVETKLGGNMPILANALGTLGLKVDCVGTMGFPQIHPVFKEMSPNCSQYSFENPGTTTALEFRDGKIMLARMNSLKSITWPKVRHTIGLDNLQKLTKGSKGFALVNWSEIPGTNSLWSGFLEEVLSKCEVNKGRKALFDLSDCSRKSKEEIRTALEIIKSFSCFMEVTLSLNLNEALLVYQAVFPSEPERGIRQLGQLLYENLGVDNLVIHHKQSSLGWDPWGAYESRTSFTNTPKLSTGGGDNFNAALLFGRMLGMDMELALTFANSAAGFYVREGHSPDIDELMQFLDKQ